MTSIHSASASLLAKRQGKEDTVRLLRSQVRSLLQKIDMDGKMKKMAELQLTVVNNPKNRRAIENQVRWLYCQGDPDKSSFTPHSVPTFTGNLGEYVVLMDYAV